MTHKSKHLPPPAGGPIKDTHISQLLTQVQAVAGAGAGDDFAYDPDWDDDDWDIDRSLLDDDDDEDEDGMGGAPVVDAAALSVVPSSDEEVTELTKSWVQAGENDWPSSWSSVYHD